MWGRRAKSDVVAESVAEAQAAREMISESGSLLADIERELGAVLTAASRALLSDDQESLAR